MKKILISFIFFVMCFTVLGVVHALNIPAPTITGVEYPSGTSLKIKYNSNNTNSNYQILLYNMTSGELVKQSVNTSSYTFTGLETGKVYNFKARVYYLENNKPQLSAWSNIVSASPKAGDVKISSITGDNTKAVINYSVTASPVGVEIYVKELGKSFRTTNLSTYTLTGLTNGKTYTVTMRTYYENGATGDWSAAKTVVPKASSTAASNLKVNFNRFTFYNTGLTKSISATCSSSYKITYKSSNTAVATVSNTGTISSKKAGSATITVTATNPSTKNSESVNIYVTVPSFKSRVTALAPWKHTLIETFFYINDRTYSFNKPGSYTVVRNSSGQITNIKTGKTGKTQSCITLPNVSFKREGFLKSAGRTSGNIWFSDGNMGHKPNGAVKDIKRKSKLVSVSYPHKSLKTLVNNGSVKYGDIVCRSGHTYVYMGQGKGDYRIYQSGTTRQIGNGTTVVWGHNGSKAKKKTNKIKKQISASNSQGSKWRSGKLTDASFNGVTASGKNLKSSIHIVVSIKTFRVYTHCQDGTITLSNNYMAGENVTVKYSPASGKKLESVTVNGSTKVDISKYPKQYTFKSISKDNYIYVVYK